MDADARQTQKRTRIGLTRGGQGAEVSISNIEFVSSSSHRIKYNRIQRGHSAQILLAARHMSPFPRGLQKYPSAGQYEDGLSDSTRQMALQAILALLVVCLST